MDSLPLERVTQMALNHWQQATRVCQYLCTPLLNVMLMLSRRDRRKWLALVQPQFENAFFALSVPYPSEVMHESAWTALEFVFGSACSQAFSVVNGNASGNQSDSDMENKMDIDPELGERAIVNYFWTLMLNCLKRAAEHVTFAGKAFESAVNMFRYVRGEEVAKRRLYRKSLSNVSPEEASDLVTEVLTLSQRELFGHQVQESVRTNSVDYVTLGWTRMLQAVVDMLPQEDIDAILPKYIPVFYSHAYPEILPASSFRPSCSPDSRRSIANQLQSFLHTASNRRLALPSSI
jgi:hypothetical protein